MSELKPAITVVMSTWAPAGGRGDARVVAARQALESWQKNLRYDGEIVLHVADDGSSHGDYGVSIDTPPASWWKGEKTFSRQEGGGVGASMNAGFRQAFAHSPLAFYVVDDWLLLEPFDLSPWAWLLGESTELGLLIFGPPSSGVRGRWEQIMIGEPYRLDASKDPHNQIYLFVPEPTEATPPRWCYGYTQRPGLYHKRFVQKHGWMDENDSSIWSERFYNERWSKNGGGMIGWPHVQNYWRHVPQRPSFGLVHPGKRR